MDGAQRVFEKRERKRENAHGGDDRGKRERARAEHLRSEEHTSELQSQR